MKKRFNKSNTFILFTILITLSFIFSTYSIADNTNPVIGEDDIYEKNVSIQSTVCFNWTLYKNSDIDYIVTVKATGFESLNQELKPCFFFLDEENPHEIVGLKAIIPQYPEFTKKQLL